MSSYISHNFNRSVPVGDVIAYTILAIVVLFTIFFAHERNQENNSIAEFIKTQVQAEVARTYRNVPHIRVEKAYALYATGQDVTLLEETNNGTGIESEAENGTDKSE